VVRHRPSRLICRIDVTGFLAIMLFLYFLFAIPAAIVIDPIGPSVDLPVVIHSVSLPGAGRDDAIVIAVQRDGSIFLGTQRLSKDELTHKISERIHQGALARVFIQADARCKYLAVKGVLESVRAAGIEKVAFLTSPRGRSGLL
jgi:biopolymer transport protein ExbD